mgnify:CR=1 FL=1
MSTLKVLIFEPIHQKGLDHLKENAVEIVYASGFEPRQIWSSVENVDAIIARAQGYIDGAVMDHAPHLKVIGRHGRVAESIRVLLRVAAVKQDVRATLEII